MAGNHVLLETIELTQSASSVTFDNIPQSGYTDLKIVVSARCDISGSGQTQVVRFNGLTTNLSDRYLFGTGSSVVSGTDASLIQINDANGQSTTSNTFSSNEIYIPNYTSSNYKSVSAEGIMENNATAAQQMLTAGLWSSTAAITSVTIALTSNNYVAYSTFSLYGVADVNTTPVTAPLATGGNMVANDGTYWIHTFYTSGTFTPQTDLSCDYLVVAGGGGGGNDIGGGGGAGGFRTSTGLSAAVQSYAITVGAGGAGGTVGANGTNGTVSTFSTISSSGGGGGGAYNLNGASGGSGGGGGSTNSTQRTAGSGNAGSYSPVEGYAGGNGYGSSSVYAAGGGGGASAVGSVGTSGTGGAGGTGTANSYSGSSITYSTGGTGWGGTATGSPTDATANTGNGGMGGKANSVGGAGGSGIIIIRYAMV